jgi:hypothetical protein
MCVIMCDFFRNENKFLLSGLKLQKYQTWHERQAAYVAAVKDFVVKMKPDFTNVEVKFVRSMRVEPRLYLAVECGNPFQYNDILLIGLFIVSAFMVSFNVLLIILFY